MLMALVLLLASTSAHADLNYMDIKGVHSYFKAELEPYSPIYGFTLLGTPTLENLRFYGNFGPEKTGLDCFSQASEINSRLVKKNDCPQDKTTEWIQRLFPAPDGVNLTINRFDSDPVSHLNSETIGKVLVRLTSIKDSDLTEFDQEQGLVLDLKNIFYEGVNPLSYYEGLRKSLEKRAQALKKDSKVKSGTEHCQIDCVRELEFIAEENVRVQASLKKLNSVSGALKGRGKFSDFEKIAELFVAALKESRLHSRSYPRYLPEQILLAFFWKKGNNRKDLWDLLKGFGFLKGDHPSENFLQEKYIPVSNDWVALNNLSKGALAEILKDPEKLVYFAYRDQFESRSLPPLLSYGSAKHASLGREDYPDCGETSLRNFFNIMLFNRETGKFDVNILKDLEKINPTVHVHPNLIAFYKKHPEAASSVNQNVRDDWSQEVVSDHEGVKYKLPKSAPRCEISSAGGGIDNMWVVLDRLLFHGRSVKAGSLGLNVSHRAQKIEELCHLFSRKGFQLSWSLKGKPDPAEINHMPFAEIVFSINNVPSFIWDFQNGHFLVEDLSFLGQKDGWRAELAPLLAKRMGEPGSFLFPLLLNWFLDENNWSLLGLGPSSKNLELPTPPHSQDELQRGYFIFALPLASHEVKIFAFEQILKNKYSFLYPTAQRIQSLFPEDDYYAQDAISNASIAADYPLGIPSHALGMPEDIKYTRILGDSHLVRRHGGFFQRAWKDPRGLIWSDAIPDPQVRPLAMPFERAAGLCKEMGARLPTLTEWGTLFRDMGGDFNPSENEADRGYFKMSSTYIPQFLKNLDETYWSSTPPADTAGFYYAFEGLLGQLVKQEKDKLGFARCVVTE